ncbi:MAG: hypothetical protein U0Z44_12075 [Kouleothrix sp.]
MLLAVALLAGRGWLAETRYAPLVALRGRTAVAAQASALANLAACTGIFAAHDLDHTTAAPARIARMFEGNGSGVAIDDLDGDGRPEVVLANSYGPNTIL